MFNVESLKNHDKVDRQFRTIQNFYDSTNIFCRWSSSSLGLRTMTYILYDFALELT